MYERDGALIDQYRKMHEAGHFEGQSLLPHASAIAALVRRYAPGTLLDYGCGKGWQYTRWNAHKAWGGLLPALYDPAVPGHSTPPVGEYDGVICTDVAEHVPEPDVPAFLRDLLGHARFFVFLTVSGRPAGKDLPDGRNAHLTVQPRSWWQFQVTDAALCLGRHPHVDLRYLP